MAHTPRPWKITSKGLVAYHIYDANSLGIAETLERDSEGEEEANAYLIGASADLLAFARRILGAPSAMQFWDEARAAIAKAEGGEAS